ncbi:MAG: tetratricopeptide TPR_4, partial [Microgenomates bacterium 39_7]
MSSRKKIFFLIIILALAFFSRFAGLNWGKGYHFHPDENNMAQAVLSLDKTNQPDFYAYGQLPLFLALFSARTYNLFSFIHQQNQLDFSEAVFFLRFWSATAGVVSVFLVYLLGEKLIDTRSGIIAALVTVFLPGLIQTGHFGTTESYLTLFYLAIAYFSLKIYQEKDPKNFLFTGLLLGLALATKITAAAFFLLPLTASVLAGRNDKRPVGDLAKNIFAGSLLAVITWLIFSPFLVIRFSQTLTTLKYEVAIAKGEIIPFYTRQFLDTIPVWFQGKKILPFLLGWPIFVISLWGVIKLLKEKKDQSLW